MSEVTKLYPTADDLVEAMKGPRASGYRVIIEGRAIPHLTLIDEGSDVHLILDGRFSIDIPRDCAQKVAWFVANALAIGQGYSHLGAESKEQPFAPRACQIQVGQGTER